MKSHPALSNTARFAARPLSGGGTPARVWLGARRELPVLDHSSFREIVVVGAHPDDETFGFGGTIAMMADAGVRVQVLSASDGGASHPDLPLPQRRQLEQLRRAELRDATDALGIPRPLSLGLPDGRIGDHEAELADMLTEILAACSSGTWCAATWCGDGHPDHEAVGRAAAVAIARTGTRLLEYPVWMWHWAHPDDAVIPWHRACKVPLNRATLLRKHIAVQVFRSQLEPAAPGAAPVIPAAVLRRLLAVGEVVFR
jgi:LmbE family N-acetylglucosaminyl deacetylase